MAFEPIQEPNSCVVNAIAYLKGENSVPEDWMIDYNNLHQEGKNFKKRSQCENSNRLLSSFLRKIS